MALNRSRSLLPDAQRLPGYVNLSRPTGAWVCFSSFGAEALPARRRCQASNAIHTSIKRYPHLLQRACGQVHNFIPKKILSSSYADQFRSPSLNIISSKTTIRSVFHSDTGIGIKSSVIAPAASSPDPDPNSPSRPPSVRRENIYTLPNFLTSTRILLCPLLAYTIIHEHHLLSSTTLLYCGLSDWLDGRLARKYPKQMSSVLGTILDPAADKILMTTLVISLGWKELLPLPLAVLIVGRDVLLAVSALYFRYQSLPPPKTFNRFWDFSLPSAEVKPTQISKYNTFLQLSLVGLTTIVPIVPLDLSTPLTILQWTVAFTTLTSGVSYIFSKDAIRYLK